MASPAEAKMPNASGKEAPEGANVDKIRDILFGSQMRDYEKRFTRLEDNVTKALETLREDMTKRLDTLGGFVRQEVDSLSQRVKTEKAERSEGLEGHRSRNQRRRENSGKEAFAARRANVRWPRRTSRKIARALKIHFRGYRQAAPRDRQRIESRSGCAAR